MSLNGSPKWMYNAGSNFYNGVISQSLRVQNSHHLERTPSTGGNQSTWTFSAWIKRSKLGSVQHIWTPIVEVMVQMSQHLDSLQMTN